MAWGNRLLDDSRLVDGVTDWWTVWASVWLNDWLTVWLDGETRDKARRLFSPQRRGVTGLTIPDRLAQKGTREPRWSGTTSSLLCFLISLAPFGPSSSSSSSASLDHLWTWEWREEFKYSIWKTHTDRETKPWVLLSKITYRSIFSAETHLVHNLHLRLDLEADKSNVSFQYFCQRWQTTKFVARPEL